MLTKGESNHLPHQATDAIRGVVIDFIRDAELLTGLQKRRKAAV